MSADDARLASVRAAYDAVAEPYAADFVDEMEHKPLDRSLVDAFAELCGGGDDRPVVDLGCGPGHAMHHLRSRGLRVLGVDLSPVMLAVARSRYPALPVCAGSLLDLPVADAACAGVLSLYSIIHLPRPVVPVALREFHRVLRPGGRVLLGFHAGTGQVHLDEWFGRAVSLDGHLFDPTDIAAELDRAGLVVEARVDRHPYPGIEVRTERCYLLARRGPAGA